MSENVRSAIITAVATVIAALISGFVAFKIADKSAKEEIENQFKLKFLPIGSILPFTGDLTDPVVRRELKAEGWLFCDGGDIPEDPLYDDLRKILGHDKFGKNKLPDLRGKTIIGFNEKDIIDAYTWGDLVHSLSENTLGEIVGEEYHILTVEEMPMHNHRISLDRNQSVNDGLGGSGNDYGIDADFDTESQESGYGVKDKVLEKTGGNRPHNNMQPSLVVNFIIKANNAS